MEVSRCKEYDNNGITDVTTNDGITKTMTTNDGITKTTTVNKPRFKAYGIAIPIAEIGLLHRIVA